MTPTKERVYRAVAYRWEDDRGVVAVGKTDTQAIQLLLGPASWAFRKMCGQLLVDALNRQACAEAAAKKRRKRGRVR